MTVPTSVPVRPYERGFSMPPEWHHHRRTWMAFPAAGYTLDDADAAYAAWSSVADIIVRHEPVTMLVDPAQLDEARRRVDGRVELVPCALDDAWMRDIGPTFLLGPNGRRAGVDWVFNGWGQQPWAHWEHDAGVAAFVLERSGVERFASTLVNEGGAIHVDGDGTVLVTETVLLDPDRNPGWSHAEVEAELRATLGARHAVWLARGLTGDHGTFGTRGHIDTLAAFVRPGLVVAHRQPDPAHPDHAVTTENLARLAAATDAHGRPLTVVPLDAPACREVGDHVAHDTYVNYYVGNGFVLLGTFADERDAPTRELLASLYPDRVVETCDARPLFASGGGVHCITQQEPG